MGNFDFVNDVYGSEGAVNLNGKNHVGMESFLSEYISPLESPWIMTGSKIRPHLDLNPKMDFFEEMKQRRDQNRRLLISTKDNVTFRLYFTEMTEYDDPVYQKRFCKLLRCLSATQTLHIHLGNACYGTWPVFTYGCMIDAINRSQGNVVTHLNGRSSFSETVLWLYGRERVISEFSTITFVGLQKHLETAPMWRPYFETFLQRAVDVRILHKEEVESLLYSGKNLSLSYRDIIARLKGSEEEASQDEPMFPENVQ